MDSDRDKLLEALQLEKQGHWDAAHRIVQVLQSTQACHIHAYLHRKEGDLSNANYWYRRAGEKMPESDLDTEWQTLQELIVSIPEHTSRS